MELYSTSKMLNLSHNRSSQVSYIQKYEIYAIHPGYFETHQRNHDGGRAKTGGEESCGDYVLIIVVM